MHHQARLRRAFIFLSQTIRVILRQTKTRVQSSRARSFADKLSRLSSVRLVADLPHLKHDSEAKKPLRHAFKMELCARGLPEKTIAKNFVSVTTYPHSGSDHLEKPPFTKRT
jgi:hypothetical protein